MISKLISIGGTLASLNSFAKADSFLSVQGAGKYIDVVVVQENVHTQVINFTIGTPPQTI